MVGVVVGSRGSARSPDTARAADEVREVWSLLERHGFTPITVAEPGGYPFEEGAAGGRKRSSIYEGHGPALVLWSAHGGPGRAGVLPPHGTEEAQSDGNGVVNRHTSADWSGGTDQVLMLIDTGDVGADAGVALENALRTLEERGLVPGRAAWLGVVAGSGSKGESASGDTLARTLARVLGEDVQAPVHRHEWSQHHAHISGPAVIEPVQASWTRSRGGRPASAADGPTPQVFEAPAILPYPTPGPLVRAAQGMDPDLEDRFFTGRHRVLSDIAHWLEDRQPGIFLLTGAPGSGKSAVLGRIVALSDPLQRADLLAHGALRPGDPDPGVNTVDVSLCLSGLTVHQLASAVADGLGLPRPPTPSSLIADLERGGRDPVSAWSSSWTVSTKQPPTRPTACWTSCWHR